MGLSQETVGKLFVRCQDPDETEEVLMAYMFAKWSSGGNQNQVLRKLHLLTLYLRGINLGAKLRAHYSAFVVAANLSKQNHGPLIVLPTTPIGLEAWNAARRPSQSVLKRAFNRSMVDVVSAGLQGSGMGSSEDSDADADSGGETRTAARRPLTSQGYAPRISVDTIPEARTAGGLGSLFAGRGNRSRSNTVTVQAVVIAPNTARAVENRRTAGAGDGLGMGLLSAPPNYNARDLAEYLESDPTLHHTARQRDPDVDFLPGYA
ncbi:hypothetical protein JCM11641_004305 [Rhodosporidiobolus odoratus]